MEKQKSDPFLIIDHDGTKVDFVRKICIGIARSIVVIVSQLYGVFPHLVFMLLLRPFKSTIPNLYWYLEGIGYRGLLLLAASWQWSAGYTVAEVGDELTEEENDRAVVTLNHQSTADVPSCFYALQPKGNVIERLMWIQSSLFKVTDFGWVSMVHEDFFIDQGKETRSLQNEKLAKHIEESYIPSDKSWIMVFPEGGFLYKRRESSQRYAKKNGYPHLEHVSLPRVGALQTILKCLSPKAHPEKRDQDGNRRPLKWLIDITIGYPENKTLNLQTLMMGTRRPFATTFHYRKFNIEDVPLDTDELTQWLYKRFEEKEQMLDFFYKNGQFPAWNSDSCKVDTSQVLKPRHIQLSDGKVAFVYIGFLVAAYYTWHLMVGPLFGLVGYVLGLIVGL